MALPLGQGLPGLTGSQALGGVPLGTTAKSSGVAPYTVVYSDNSGNGTSENQTWTCPKAGTYRFVQWAKGGLGNGAAPYGGGGAHAQTVRKIAKGATVTINSDSTDTTRGTKITLTLPDGTSVVTTGGQRSASGGAAGVATGGDINVNGSVGVGNAGGQAGSYGNYIGGVGADIGTGIPQYGVTPGGGAAQASFGPGSALVLIVQEA